MHDQPASVPNDWNFGAAAFALAPLRAKAGSGSGSHTHLKKFMRLLSVPWSSFPQLKWLAEP